MREKLIDEAVTEAVRTVREAVLPAIASACENIDPGGAVDIDPNDDP